MRAFLVQDDRHNDKAPTTGGGYPLIGTMSFRLKLPRICFLSVRCTPYGVSSQRLSCGANVYHLGVFEGSPYGCYGWWFNEAQRLHVASRLALGLAVYVLAMLPPLLL